MPLSKAQREKLDRVIATLDANEDCDSDSLLSVGLECLSTDSGCFVLICRLGDRDPVVSVRPRAFAVAGEDISNAQLRDAVRKWLEDPAAGPVVEEKSTSEDDEVTRRRRVALDEQIRAPIRAAVAAGMTTDEITFLLTRMLPELVNRERALGHIAAAFDVAAVRDRA